MYRIRPATLDDLEALVHHRLGMFTDMGVPIDRPAIEDAFRRWVADAIPHGAYRAWLIETDQEAGPRVVAGGGITVLTWPPGPFYLGGRVAFVYNVYTEPSHRRRGLARMVMDAIHGWCRSNGVGVVGLNASDEARRLYESLGYRPAANPLMWVDLQS